MRQMPLKTLLWMVCVVMAVGMAASGPSGGDKSGTATVAPGSPHAASLVACSTWEITETFFPPKHDGKITTATFNSGTLQGRGFDQWSV
jgi:hypothetical protein